MTQVMPKDLASEFLRLRKMLLQERENILSRLDYLNEILGQPAPEEIVQEAVDATSLEELPTPPKRRGRKPSVPAGDPSSPLDVVPAAHEFPVSLFPFPARAFTAFARMEIKKLGQLQGLLPNQLGKSTGKKTFEGLQEVIRRVNAGDLFFPLEDSVPVQSFCTLIDSALSRLEASESTALRLRFGAEGEPLSLENIGQQLGLTRERIRQMTDETLTWLARFHGMKMTQIGKELTAKSKEKGVDFGDISDPLNPGAYAPEFYMTLLKKLFPGLQAIPQAGSNPAQEPPSPDDLRQQIFG